MFIGRNTELEYLDRFFQKEGSQILVLYGVKGIGKTEILKAFTAGRRVSYYMAGAVSEREQRAEWAKELKKIGYPIRDIPEYEEILKTVLPENAQKKILVIDEFHYLIRSDSSFFADLADFLDKRRMSRPVFVVLLSSAPGFIENNLISAIGSKAAYIDGILKLKELTFREMCRLYPNFSRLDAFLTYMTLGGVPGLWEGFDSGSSYRENVKKTLLRKSGGLYQEMAAYFAEDLREPAVYNTILLSIAAGRCKLNDIFEYTGFSRAKISVYLKNLMELNLIEKIYAGVYRISVPCLSFYYRFLFPERGLMEKITADSFYERVIDPFLIEYAKDTYAKVCRQEYEAENPDGFDISEWYDKDHHLELVTVDKDARRVAGICRLQGDFGKAEYKKLTALLRHAKIQPDRLLFFGEGEESDELKKLIAGKKIEHIRLGIEIDGVSVSYQTKGD